MNENGKEWKIIEKNGKTTVMHEVDIRDTDRNSLMMEIMSRSMVIAEDLIENKALKMYSEFGYYRGGFEQHRKVRVTIEILEPLEKENEVKNE